MNKKIIFFVVMAMILVVGFLFENDILNFYNDLTEKIQSFQKTDVGNLITQAGKEIFSPPPLSVERAEQPSFLTVEKIIIDTNLQRKDSNLPVLAESEKLDEAAAAKADDMFQNQYFDHVSPTGVGPGQLVQNYGYNYILAGENLILGNFANEEELVKAWMDSPGHRANILNSRYTEIGIAVKKGTYKGQNVWIAVQEFGLPLSECRQPDAGLKSKIDSYRAQLDTFAAEIDARRVEIDSQKPSLKRNNLIDVYNQLIQSYNSLAQTIKELILQYNNQVSAFNTCVNGK